MARRMRGEGAVYQRQDGRWVGELDLGWVDGKRRRRLFYGKTQEEAGRRLREAQRKADEGTLTLGPGLTVEAWLRHWLEEVAARKVRASTLLAYRLYVEQHLIPAIGKHRLDGPNRLRPSHVRALHATLADNGLAPASIVKAHRILARALRVAEQEELVTRNVASVVGVAMPPRAAARPFTVTEARAILGASRGLRNGVRWPLALALGMRQGERLGLGWHEVDLDAGLLTVAAGRSLQRLPYQHGCGGKCPKDLRAMRCPERTGGLIFVDPKSDTSRRTLPLPASLTLELRAHRQVQLEERLAAGAGWDDRGLVFAQPTGRPVDPRRDWQDWQDMLAGLEIPRGRVHDARHAAATILKDLGVDPKVSQAILGHASVVTTMSVYQHAADPQMVDAMARMDDALWGALPVTLAVKRPAE